MGNLLDFPSTLLSYLHDFAWDPNRNLPRLTNDQRTALIQFKDSKEIVYRVYGEDNLDVKPCKRLKTKTYWTKRPPDNHITKYPGQLKLCHTIYMLFHNVQLPSYKQLQLCHLCVDPHPTAWGNRCIEITHLVLGSPNINKEMRICQTIIRKFGESCNFQNFGVTYLKDVPRSDRPAEHKDRICNHGCFGINGEST